MRASNRIIINTLAQYGRTILNLILSLYSARLVLNILGVVDYGIYSLVGGVVVMLSFVTSSLANSTQRFLSLHQGRDSLESLKAVFSNSVILHIIVGFVVLIVLEAISPLLFNGFLNIAQDRCHAAELVYQTVTLTVYISFVSIPFKALLISRENIIYTSIIDVLDGILKVALVLLMLIIPLDKLVVYAWLMLAINIFNLIALAVYPLMHYEECIIPRMKYVNKSYFKELSSFTGWITYSTVCIALRNQGLAIVLNKFRGAIINAAYGIGMQITGLVSFVSTSLCNAVAPQLTAAEGGNDRNRMFILAEIQSKYSFLLLAMVGIPVMFEMESILKLWLGEAPEYTAYFGCMFIIMQILDALTSGLGTANRAIGNIRNYILVTFTPKLIALPLCFIALCFGYDVLWVCATMVVVEGLCAYLRIPMMRYVDEFDEKKFFRNVLIKTLPPTIAGILSCWIICSFISCHLRLFVTFFFSIPIFCYVSYRYSMTESERYRLNSLVIAIVRRLRRINKEI